MRGSPFVTGGLEFGFDFVGDFSGFADRHEQVGFTGFEELAQIGRGSGDLFGVAYFE